FRSYFHDRSQVIFSGGVFSDTSSLVCGVPQGSVLGPLLFTLYTVDILRIIEHNGLNGHMYADDTQIYCHFHPSRADMALTQIQECFVDLQMWMNNNKLVLNAAKTEIILFGSQHLLDKFGSTTITLGDVQVPISD